MSTAVRSRAIVTLASAALVLAGCGAQATPATPDPPPSDPAPVSSAPEEPVDEETTPEDDDEEAEIPSWEGLAQSYRDSVAYIRNTTCEGESKGSGFLIGPDLVVTNAHVVHETVVTTAQVDGRVRNLEVIGYDAAVDLALLRLDDPVDAEVFSWAESAAPIGSEVAALGYPLGLDFSLVTGVVSGYETVDEGNPWLVTSAPLNPGNSGGALVSSSGEVVGVVFAGANPEFYGHPIDGIGYAIPLTTARPLIDGWQDEPQRPGKAPCVADTEADPRQLVVENDISDPAVLSAIHSVAQHGSAINFGLFDSAFELFSQEMQEAMGSQEEWAAGIARSQWVSLDLRDHEVTDDGVTLHMSLRTSQPAEFGRDGQTCSDWDLTYSLVSGSADEGFLIDEATANGDPLACDA